MKLDQNCFSFFSRGEKFTPAEAGRLALGIRVSAEGRRGAGCWTTGWIGMEFERGRGRPGALILTFAAAQVLYTLYAVVREQWVAVKASGVGQGCREKIMAC